MGHGIKGCNPLVRGDTFCRRKLKMSPQTSILIFALCAVLCGATEEFSYDAQDEWPGICVSGNDNRQSPIDIVTDDVQQNDALVALELSDSWENEFDGTFVNGGHNVQFNPNFGDDSAPTTTNHIGTYVLHQFHFHWGATSAAGSEHLVDGEAAQLEVHFVHTMQGATDSSAEDYYSVIGVLVDVDEDAAVTGPWAVLDAEAIEEYNSNITVNGFSFDMLLPTTDIDRDYYFYEGSLTTPNCGENVNWFVLKERITVPGAYLENLRQIVSNEEGDLLTFNFRDTQDIGDRVVYTASSQALKPFITLLTFCLIAIKLA